MGSVRLWRFPEFGVTMQHYSDGVITPELLFQNLGLLQEGDMVRWIGYLDATSDFSRIDLAALSTFRRDGVARLRALGAKNMLLAFVSPPGRNDLFIDFWNRFFQLHRELPGKTARFSDLKSACDWLGLSEAAHPALAAAVETGTVAGCAAQTTPQG